MKRKSSNKHQPSENFQATIDGTVPWSLAEFNEIMAWIKKFATTHKKHAVLPDDKITQAIGPFFSLHPMDELASYMREKYGDKMPHHFDRFTNMMQFFALYFDNLKADGFIRQGKDDMEINMVVFQVLCTLPYSKSAMTTREKVTAFNYDEVVKKARELLTLSGEQVK